MRPEEEMRIAKSVIAQIVNHAKKDAPLEACGYLAGADGIVTKHYPLTNIDKSSEHFSFDPKEQFSAVKDARGRGLGMYAVYHSHPATAARPSQEDISLAHDAQMAYVIISLAEAREDIKVFTIRNGKADQAHLEAVDDKGI